MEAMNVINYLPILLAAATVVLLGIAIRRQALERLGGLILFGLSLLLLAGVRLLYLLDGGLVAGALRLVTGLGYLGLTLAPIGIFIFTARYTRNPRFLSLPVAALVLAVPVALQVLLLTDGWQGFFLESGADPNGLAVHPGVIWREVAAFYIICISAGAAGLLLLPFSASPRPFRRQGGLLMAGSLVSGLLSVLAVFLDPFLHQSPLALLGLAVNGLAVAYCMRSRASFETVPIPRQAVIENHPDGIVVLDGRERIVDMNRTAEEFIGITRHRAFGQPVETVLENWADLPQVNGAGQAVLQGSVWHSDGLRHYEVYVLPMLDGLGQPHGKIITWKNVTEQKKQADTWQRTRDGIFALQQSISGAAGRSMDWKEFLTQVMYQAVYSFHCQAGVIFLVEQDPVAAAARLSLVTQHGLAGSDQEQEIAFWESRDLAQRALQTREIVHAPGTGSGGALLKAMADRGYVSLLVAPLLVDRNVIGVIGLGRREGIPFGADDAALVRLTADETAAYLHSDQQRELAVAQAERQRIVKDLHDSINNSLLGLINLIEAARLGLRNNAVTDLAPILDKVSENARHALKEMRLFMFELSPVDLKREGLVAVLNRRLAAVEGRTDVAVKFVTGDGITLAQEKQVALYFIAQEALNNILKHSKARNIDASLSQEGSIVSLVIADDGVGFDPAHVYPGSIGLRSMRERAAQIGARFSLESAPGSGTRVEVSIRGDKLTARIV